MAETCLPEYDELSSVVVEIDFLDEDGNPVTPTSAGYRLDDETNGRVTNIQSSTVISPLSTTVSLVMQPSWNRILRTRNTYEVRLVTLQYNYTSITFGPMQRIQQYRYRVNNLKGAPLEPPSPSVSPSLSVSPSASASPST